MNLRKSEILLVGLAFVCATNAQSQCSTPNSYEGLCVPLNQCPTWVHFIDMRRGTGLPESETEFLTQSQCSSVSQEESYVCCNKDDLLLQTKTTTIGTPNIDSIQSKRNGGSQLLPTPTILQCGLGFLSNRIFNGNNTELGEFPWMVLLEYQNAQGVKGFWCGGSLINDRYILTAAHCLIGPIETANGPLISVRLGEHNLNTTEDCEVYDGISTCADPVQDIAIERIIPHPYYGPTSQNQHHDIGLVRLSQKVTYSEYIHPLCLPSAQLRTQTGHNLTVAGWGRTQDGPKSDIKQKLSIPVFDQQECINIFGSIGRSSREIEDTQLCAGGTFLHDSCEGDSGGPLMFFNRGLWYAEGIVSYGHIICGLSGFPGVYTRVAHYLDWINSVLES